MSSSSGASAATASVAASPGRANSPAVVSGAQSAKSAPSAAATAAAPAAVPKLDLSQYPDAKALKALGIDALKVTDALLFCMSAMRGQHVVEILGHSRHMHLQALSICAGRCFTGATPGGRAEVWR